MNYKGQRVFIASLYEKESDAADPTYQGDILGSFDGQSKMIDLLDYTKTYPYDETGEAIGNGITYVGRLDFLFPYKYNNKNIKFYRRLKEIALALNKDGSSINIPGEVVCKVKGRK